MAAQSSFRSDSANLDLIRAVAVLSVFFAHLSGQLVGPSELAWHFGQLGVLIFFVHTSMVLMLSLERSAKSGAPLVWDFYIRRWFRIYPLAIVCVTIVFIVQSGYSWPTYLANVTLTQNLTYHADMVRGLWTLPLEVQMYIALPLLFLAFRQASIRWVLVAWGVAVVLGTIQPLVSGRLGVVGFAPCFLGGILAWRLSRAFAPCFSGSWWPVVFAATWTVWLVASRETDMYFRWLFCVTLGFAIPWFEEISSRSLRAVAKTIAKYSYGIYLSHFAIIQFAFGYFGDRSAPFRWSVLLLLTLTVPVLMFRCIEQPMMNLGRRIADRKRAQEAPSSAPVAAAV